MEAFIICGGKSKRMGQDKAQIKIHGKAMANLIADKLISAGLESVVMVSKHKKTFPSDYPFVFDLIDTHHPLAGIATALYYAQKKHAFIICCDLPWVQNSDIQRLLMGPYPCIAKSQLNRQPLFGIYPKDWGVRARQFIRHNKRANDFAQPCHSIEVDAKSLKNVNYPCDLGD